MALALAAHACGAAAALLVMLIAYARARRLFRRGKRVVAFLHPHCAAGGGGERVLWVGLVALREATDARIVVYTGDVGVGAAAMRARAADRFGVTVPADVEFVYVRSRRLSEPGLYPVATMIGQSLGSMVLAAEAVLRLPPDVFVDTTGYGFSFPVVKLLAGAATAAYVHYPTISGDMIGALGTRAFNNRGLALALPKLKALYYELFAVAYGWCGRRCDAVMANSSWTRGHIQKIWRRDDVALAYPPCDTSVLEKIAKGRPGDSGGPVVVASLAQFRPEKDHALQLEAWALLPEATRRRARLVVAGAARHADDRALLDGLRRRARDLGISDSVEFKVSAPRSEILDLLRGARVGLHTMRLEHFGIAVVEFMAAGLVPLAHASGGPLLDIVGADGDRGLVATDAPDYAAKLAALVDGPRETRDAMAANARAFVADRFSDAAFSAAFVAGLAGVLP